jgi:hypothetical protein
MPARPGVLACVSCICATSKGTHGGQPPAVVYFNTIETDQQVQAVA